MTPRCLTLVVVLASACAQDGGGPGEQPATEAPGGSSAVARCGKIAIGPELVGSVAAAQGITPRAALDHLVEDALLARSAMERGVDRSGPLRFPIQSARARMFLRRAHREAESAGAPTDDEIRQLSEEYWADVDIPPRVRVVHVVVRPKSKTPTPEQEARAKAVAERFLEALSGATNEEEFIQKARAVPHEKVDVVIQPLPPFTQDGRVVRDSPMLREFAASAFEIPLRQVRAVESSAGHHVVMALERLPPESIPWDERRVRFADLAQKLRAETMVAGALESARRDLRIEISPAAEGLMAVVSAPASTNAD